MMRRALTGVLLCAMVRAHAQEDRLVPRDLIEQRIEAAAERLGDESDVDLTALFEVLADRFRDPLDLNRTTAEDLAELQLLSDVQIGALFEHIRTEGPLLSTYELQTIDAFDPGSIALIRPFVTVREQGSNTRVPFRELLRLSEHEVIVRSIADVQQRKGYLGRDNLFGSTYTDPDGDALPDVGDSGVLDSLRNNGKAYLGSPYKLYARYRMRYRQNLSLGITAEKDEGEEFFSGSQPDGFDFYSAHLFLRDIGPLKALAIGDYQAQFGQGLTYWSGLAYAGKSSYTMNIKRNAPGLLPYASVNENLFLRGIGATAELARHLELTGFWSQRALDGNVAEGDTTDSGDPEVTFSSFQEDGLHRTPNEIGKKDAIGERTLGAHLRYRTQAFSAGGTVTNVAYDAPLSKDLKPYNRFDFTGDDLTKYGLDWNLLHRNLSWFGEASMTGNGTVAWLSGVLLAAARNVSISMLYRDFPRDFHGLYSVAFAEGSNAWNERGIYTGIEVRATRQWTLNAYFDQYRSPWLRYQTDAPSNGYDMLAQLTYKPTKTIEIYGRVRHRTNQRNAEGIDEGIDPLVDVQQTNYRLNASYKVSKSVSLRTRAESVDFQRGASPLEHGFLLYQDIVHRPLRSPVEFTFRVALFQTDSYDARVYAYENDLIGLFTIPPYYGRGMRWYAMARFTPVRRVDVWVRYAAWLWNGQDRYSSGLSEIDGSGDPATGQVTRSDLKVQVRWKF